jgi:hypothetical protein
MRANKAIDKFKEAIYGEGARKHVDVIVCGMGA